MVRGNKSSGMFCEIFIPVVYIVNLFIALSRLTSNVFDGAAELRTVKRAVASAMARAFAGGVELRFLFW